MHVPDAYSVTDTDRLHALMKTHSFALLVSNDVRPEAAPIATHLPLLVEVENGKPVRLTGHMARGNPQWEAADGRPVLAIFAGPNAYISAAWYGEKNVVPTWNYVSVHVTGTLTVDRELDRVIHTLKQSVDFYESNRSAPWTMESTDSTYRHRLTAGIVAFSISIDQIQGCWKLNQHHSQAKRDGVIAGLKDRGHSDDLAIAALMRDASQT